MQRVAPRRAIQPRAQPYILMVHVLDLVLLCLTLTAHAVLPEVPERISRIAFEDQEFTLKRRRNPIWQRVTEPGLCDGVHTTQNCVHLEANPKKCIWEPTQLTRVDQPGLSLAHAKPLPSPPTLCFCQVF
jgi:hypothetical protein